MGDFKIILTDESAILLSAVRILINRLPGVKVVGETSKGNSLLNKLRTIPCDLVWMDTSFPDSDGFEIISQIRKDFPFVKILIYTSYIENKNLENTLALGVQGILLKDDDFSIIPIAIETIRNGGTYFSGRLTLSPPY